MIHCGESGQAFVFFFILICHFKQLPFQFLFFFSNQLSQAWIYSGRLSVRSCYVAFRSYSFQFFLLFVESFLKFNYGKIIFFVLVSELFYYFRCICQTRFQATCLAISRVNRFVLALYRRRILDLWRRIFLIYLRSFLRIKLCYF